MANYYLHEDRFFSPQSSVRKIAREIYLSVRDLPIISPHGHVDPNIFIENNPFPDPAALFLTPDHYLFRMLYSRGISLESLGIPTADGTPVETDARKIWKKFGENYFLFNGTPSGIWLDYEFNIVFGIKEKLNGGNALKIYDELAEKINSPEFLPRNLFEKFNIEVLATTDAATDNLDPHKKIDSSGMKGRVIPSFRPDGLTELMGANWNANIKLLGEITGSEITSYYKFISAIEQRRKYFIRHGATAADHGILSPLAARLTDEKAETIFQKALNGDAAPEDAALFTAHMLMEMARMSSEDGMVMMIHPGACRNHNKYIFDRFGPDKGGDIPATTEFTNNLKELLNCYGNNPKFTLIVFTLDESAYSRELAPLAGHYPAMKLGPPWWFHDSIEGMKRFRESTTETAGFYNTIGFIDDTRAFISIPARHDTARRIDSNYLAGLAARHIISKDEAFKIAKDITYYLSKKTFNL